MADYLLKGRLRGSVTWSAVKRLSKMTLEIANDYKWNMQYEFPLYEFTLQMDER